MGQKYAAYDEQGVITAYYDSVDSLPPPETRIVELTEKEWMDCISQQGWTVVNGGLVAPAQPTAEQMLNQARQAQAAMISAACERAITGGFQSAALGKPHTYPSNSTDQVNLAANVLSSLYPDCPENWSTLQLCADADGNWAYRHHSATQIQQVGTDSKAASMACLTKNADLQALISAAETIAAVQAIQWS